VGEITVCVDGVGGLCELISGHLELNSVTGISNILVFIGAEPSVNNTVHGRGAVGVEVGGETVDDSVKHLLVVIVIYHHSFFRDIITSRLILLSRSSIILNDFVAVIVILRLLRESLGLGDTELGGVLGHSVLGVDSTLNDLSVSFLETSDINIFLKQRNVRKSNLS